jgi:outer membrane protein assembly factor BamA
MEDEMTAWRKTLLAALVSGLAALSLPAAAPAGDDALIEFTTGGLGEIEVGKDSSVSPTGDLYYNRVDGLLAYMGVQYRAEESLHPQIDAMFGWPSAHGDSYYRIDVEQPLFRQDGFALGVNLYGRSAWNREDAEWTEDFDNNLQAFFAREDHRDYYRQEGVTLYAKHKVNERIGIRGEIVSHRLKSLTESQSVWSVFGKDEDWRENPPLLRGVQLGAEAFAGRLHSVGFSVEYDSRDEDGTAGWWARSISEFASELRIEGLEGDYDFTKHVVEAKRSFPITSTQTVEFYGMWGLSSGTDFPSHKLFHLGGRGNLRGYDYKQFGGKEMIFGRAEYRVEISRPTVMLFFFESGQVGYKTTTSESDDSDGFRHDAGVGFRIEAPWDGWLGLDVARSMEEDAEIKVHFRLLLAN